MTAPPPLEPMAAVDRADVEGLDLAELVPHPRPFVCGLTAGADRLSRAVTHVSNVEFVRWLDRAAELHSDAVGFTRERMLGEGVMWFVARNEIDYRREVMPDDRLVIFTWVRDVRRAKSWRDTVIVRPADREVVCRAATLWVLVSLDTRRPVRAGPRMTEAFDPLVVTNRDPAAAGRPRAER